MTTSNVRRAQRAHDARHRQLALARRGMHQAALRSRELGISALSFEQRVLADPLLVAVYADQTLLLRELDAVLSLVWPR